MIQYWNIDLWEDDSGVCRVDRDVLKKLRTKDKFIFQSLGEKMSKYVSVPIDKIIKSGELEKVKGEDNMWELKFHLPHKNEIRFLGYLDDKKLITITYYALYGFRKKDQTIKNQHREVARERIKEYLRG